MCTTFAVIYIAIDNDDKHPDQFVTFALYKSLACLHTYLKESQGSNAVFVWNLVGEERIRPVGDASEP